jgi:quinol monooxygenase YgiN
MNVYNGMKCKIKGAINMIKVIAKITVKEDAIDAFTKDAFALVAETRKEFGCISYQVFQDVNLKNEFTFLEEWASPEALQNHMKSTHFQETMPKFAEISEKEMDISVCTLLV